MNSQPTQRLRNFRRRAQVVEIEGREYILWDGVYYVNVDGGEKCAPVLVYHLSGMAVTCQSSIDCFCWELYKAGILDLCIFRDGHMKGAIESDGGDLKQSEYLYDQMLATVAANTRRGE